MTNEQFEAKYQELVRNTMAYLLKEGKRLLASGGIAPDSYEDSYLLPRIILTVALENLKGERQPQTPEGQHAVKNLRHF